MNRSDLQRLALVRLDEAKALLDAGYWDGAYYLAGYVVECALKARIARQVQRYDFPDSNLAEKVHVRKPVDLSSSTRISTTNSGSTAGPTHSCGPTGRSRGTGPRSAATNAETRRARATSTLLSPKGRRREPAHIEWPTGKY